VPAAVETPRTEAVFDRWYAYLEWLLEIRLTESQRRECLQLGAQHWKGADQARKDRFLASANAEFKWWADAAKQSEADAAEMRAEKRLPLLARLQRSAERDERLLLSLYESAHAPGSERNPVLVPGTPALTQEMVDQGRRWNQWVLDVRLTAAQRQEYQRLFVNNWKSWDQAVKNSFVENHAQGVFSRVMLLSAYDRDMLRAQSRSKLLTDLEDRPDDELARLLLAAEDTAHQPGGERNPVLVDGQTPLTRDMVSQFGDFLEWALDLRAGGLTVAQRRELQDLLTESWKKRDDSWKAAFAGHLEKWDELVSLSDGERAKVQKEVGPVLVAQLRSTPDPLNRWLLEIAAKKQGQP
jgi:hypothetical protein